MVREYIPLFCIPLRNKHNPVIVAPVNNFIKYSISASDGYGITITGVKDSNTVSVIEMFYKLLKKELGVSYSFNISIESNYVHRGFIYVLVTNEITKMLTGSLDVDLISALHVIDDMLGMDDCVKGLRYYEVMEGLYIWRFSENPVKLSRDLIYSIENVGCFSRFSNEESFSNSLANVLTHVTGLLIIEVFKSLDSSAINAVNKLIRLYNSLWCGIYGVCGCTTYADATCIHVPEVDGVICLEVKPSG